MENLNRDDAEARDSGYPTKRRRHKKYIKANYGKKEGAVYLEGLERAGKGEKLNKNMDKWEATLSPINSILPSLSKILS